MFFVCLLLMTEGLCCTTSQHEEHFHTNTRMTRDGGWLGELLVRLELSVGESDLFSRFECRHA